MLTPSQWPVYLTLLLTTFCQCHEDDSSFNDSVIIAHLENLELNVPTNVDDTHELLEEMEEICNLLHNRTAHISGQCPYYFADVACWKPVPNDTEAHRRCPKYFNGLDSPEDVNVSLRCTSEGRWDYDRRPENFHTVYGVCEHHNLSKPDPNIEYHRYIIVEARRLGAIGYTISLVALMLASSVFIFFKKLHCSRNFIHLHLFLAFMLRSVMCILFYYLFVDGVAFQSDGPMVENREFLNIGSHWQCKLFVTIWNYALVASYFWLLIEASYLHNVVYFFVFRETKVTYYVIFGWSASLFVMVPWLIVRILYDDYLCWVSYLNLNYFWIQRGPIMAIIIKIFLLFINILRELFIKLRDSHITEARRYRKLAKSSFVLVILLGIGYFIMTIPLLIIDTNTLTFSLAVCLSIEQILSCLQGFFVATVYCFTNTEVRVEIRKRWRRWRLYRNFDSQNANGASSSLFQMPSRARNRLLSEKSQNYIDKQLAARSRRHQKAQYLDTGQNTACSTVASSPHSSMTRISSKFFQQQMSNTSTVRFDVQLERTEEAKEHEQPNSNCDSNFLSVNCPTVRMNIGTGTDSGDN